MTKDEFEKFKLLLAGLKKEEIVKIVRKDEKSYIESDVFSSDELKNSQLD